MIGLTLAFACAGLCVHRARQYAATAPGERSTVAYDLQRRHRFMHGFRFSYSSCDYLFSVDGWTYSGDADCPQPAADDSDKEKLSGSAGAPPESIATVYYDPTDPSINSLIEFGALSQAEYRHAILWVGIGILTILPFAFIAVLTANENQETGSVVVDAEEAAIDPQDLNAGSKVGAPFGARREARQAYAAASADATNAAEADPPPELRELYLHVVNRIHPDRAANEPDLALRERLMKEANTAFKLGDGETLRKVLEEYRSVNSIF